MVVTKTKKTDTEQLFSISELTNEFSIGKDAILFYEKKRLLFSGKQRVTGRAYSEFDKFRLKFIVNAKNADYTLGDIKSLIGKIDPAKSEEIQVVELIDSAENKFDELKQSLPDMDMLGQINVTCDMELLTAYLKDIHALKSRSAVSDFNRLKLVKNADNHKQTTLLVHRKPNQRITTKLRESESVPMQVKYLQRGLYAAIALLLLMVGIYFLSFMGFPQSSSQRTLSQEKIVAGGKIQQENNIAKSLAPLSPGQQIKSGTNDIPGLAAEVETSNGIMEETVMERNKEIFARVYRDTGGTVSSDTTAEPPVTAEAPVSKRDSGPEKATKPTSQDDSLASEEDTDTVSIIPPSVTIETQTQTTLESADTPSPAVSDPSDSAISEETTASAAMATFFKKISKSPQKSEPPTPKIEKKSTPTADKPKPVKKSIKTATKKTDQAKAKQEPDKDRRKTVEHTPVITPSPIVLPPILSGGNTAKLENDIKLDTPERPAKRTPEPLPKTTAGLEKSLLSPKTSQPDLPTELLDRTTEANEKTLPKKAPAPEALDWIQKSYDHVVSGNAGEAIVAATVAISFDPDIESPYINRAWAYSKKGDHDKAIQDCNKALSINPDSAFALNNRGLAYQGKGDMDRAKADYDKACNIGLDVACRNYREITEGNTVSSLLAQIQSSYEQGKWDAVIKFSTKALRLSPGNVAAYNHRSSAYSQKGFYYKAIKDCNDAIKIDPNNALSFNNRGYALELLGNAKAAALDYKKSCGLGLDLGCQNYESLK